jgi:glutamate racemase
LKIGVFDSGVGGLSVVKAIERAMPDAEVVFRNDTAHFPYATRPSSEILGFILPIFKELVAADSNVIVVACNTVSTTLIDELRNRFDVPLIAVEPMVKPAAELTKSRVIAICATPTTLASDRYAWLKATYADGITVLEPDCSDWSYMIEHEVVDEQKIASQINSVIEQGADVIVLGCTHYHWIESEIKEIADERAQVIQPEPAIVTQLQRVLARLS